MTTRDQKGLCLGYALDRIEEITGLHASDSALAQIAMEAATTGRVPAAVPGFHRLQHDDVGQPGDLLILRAGPGLHAAVLVDAGTVEDIDPRGRRRRLPWRRVAWLMHSAWRITR